MVDKKYTEAEIKELLNGYFKIHESLYEFLPAGDHIRYFKKGKTSTSKKSVDLFCAGGFVKSHYTNPDGKKFIQLESKLRGAVDEHGYSQFYIAYDDIDELWKRYNTGAFIEIHLINTSLINKKNQIMQLMRKVDELSNEVKSLRNEFKRINKK